MTQVPVDRAGVFDTSVIIATETGRPLRFELLPSSAVTTVITLAELNAGVLAAPDSTTRAARLRTLTSLASLEVLPVDAAAAETWAQMRVHLAERGRWLNVNDLWVASIAASRQLPLVTQDGDFEPLEDFPGFSLIRV